MKIDERHLLQLAAVVQTGSVSEGAMLLGLSQPAVSRTLSLLEERLGEKLLERGRRPLSPTALGKALADQGLAILAASRKAAEIAEGFRTGTTGLVRLGGTPFFMDALITPMIAGFQNRHPEVRVEQRYGYLPDLRAALKADQIDLAVCPVDLLDEGSGLEFQPILPGHNVIACGSTHPLLMKRKIVAGDLLGFPWVAPPAGSPLNADLRATLFSVGASEPRIRYSGGSLSGVINYLITSDALTVLPHSVVFALRREKQISALPLQIGHPDRALGILRVANAPGPAVVHSFCEFVNAAFVDLRQLIKRHEQSVVWGV